MFPRPNYSGYYPRQSKSNCIEPNVQPPTQSFAQSNQCIRPRAKASSAPTRYPPTPSYDCCNSLQRPQNACGSRPRDREDHTLQTLRDQAAYHNFLLSLNPKNETRALEFVQQNPTADGRGVVIAILDTGVDPGAAGLQQTTDGKIKVIERYDCTGTGDVDTATIVKATSEITLLSGRTFPIPPTWHNPTGVYHLGFKPIFHLYPPDLVERITQERRDKIWDPAHRKAIAREELALEMYQREMNTQSRNDTNSGHLTSNELSINLHMTLQDKFKQAEIIAKVEMLIQLDKLQHKNDCGPYLDCILWKDDAEVWQICLAPTDIAELDKAILLHEYNLYHEYSSLSPSDRFNVSVNVWDDGNVLEIVGIQHPHGTHVASIAGAYFPDTPELNGVAPGAQIISLSIGDGRVVGQETGTAYTRAIARICDGTPKVHVVNTSYGEPTIWPPVGNLAKMMADVVEKLGVVWVSASGNAGPCLSTADAPAGIAEDIIITVAAYVSPDMMAAHSNTRGKGPGLTYTWCSRGPLFNGAMGVHVCAPGGAITSVPNYTLSATTMMVGSSMATPNAAGCVALLLSLAMQKGIEWTPYSVKKSLEVTAAKPEVYEVFSQGYGLIQVPDAYRMLEFLSTQVDRYVRHKISCFRQSLPGYEMHGIYIRDPKLESPKEFQVGITPTFFQDDTIDPLIKINYRQHLTLVTDADWLEIPTNFELHNHSHRIDVRVNPDGVPPGVHYASIRAMDSTMPTKGPIFSIDFTFIVPIPISYNSADMNPRVDFGTSLFTQGQVRRYFIEAPAGATWAVLRLVTSHSQVTEAASSSFVVQTVSLVPGETFTYRNQWLIVRLEINEERKITFPVVEGKIVEIAIGRWWPEGKRELDSINMTASVKFRGIKIEQFPEIVTAVHNVFTKVDIKSLISSEIITPSAKLTHQVQLLKPAEMTLATLTGPRDEIRALQKFIYELQIMYKFTVDKCTEIEVECPMLNSLLYDSDYLSQLWMLFDSHKQYITSGDYSPSQWAHEIPPGDYCLKLQVRHENVNALYRFMLPLETGKTRDLSKCKLNTTRTYNCGGQVLPLLSVLLKMSLEDPVSLYCAANLYDCLKYNDCTDGKPEDDDEEHMNCPHSHDFPALLKKTEFMTCYIKTMVDESLLEDFPSSSTTYLEGEFRASDHHDGKRYCVSNLKVYFPPNVSSDSGMSAELGDEDDEHERQSQQLHINPSDLLPEIAKPDKYLKDLNKIDLSIDYMILNKYYALAVKILIHRRKIHGEAWTKSSDAKLRTCFSNLGWTHCIYFLDSNTVIQHPPGLRPF